jgi:ABC-2 type transport system ATP-binding protein
MVIVAQDVRRRYGDTVALDGASLSVGEGEVFGLIGPNGAGKTTLVRALTGTTDADGHVELLGTHPRSVDRGRVGLLPQEFSPPERLTARELLDYYGDLYDERRPTGAVLSDVGVAGSADTRYERLSGGQKRRVCVGTALVNDPDVLFLDEPTTGIDPAGRRDVRRLVETLAAGGTTVLLTTHDMQEAERLCDRVGLLADGTLAAQGPPATLIDQYGGTPRLVVRAEDEGAAARTLEMAGYRLLPDEHRLVVDDVAPGDVGAVAEALDEAAVTYDALTWRQPDLEEVYLQLTGRAVGGGGEPRDPAGVSA